MAQPDISLERKNTPRGQLFFPVTYLTPIRPSCMTTNHPTNTFQRHHSTVLLQDFAQLINIGRTHILFYRAVFNTELFLKYRETMGTFCSTSVNPVSQSLKAVLPELPIQVTNLHSDINGHQKTSMDFLRSKFLQINDNITTTLRITT